MITRRRLIAALLFTLLTSAAAAQEFDSCPDLSGCWSGSWSSCTTGHRGPLRAEFCQLAGGDYQVNFRGRFFRIFPFRYSVVLQVVDVQGDTVTLQGSSYLGRLFGTFHYHATATSCTFRASYRSCKDAGEFCLSR